MSKKCNEDSTPKLSKQDKEYELEAKNEKGISRRDFFKKGAATGIGAAALATVGTSIAQESADDIEWHYEADVVVVGSGATGLPAAIRARDLGASVLVVDQNFEVGGRMLHSGGWVSLGGGDALQERDIAGSDPDGMGLTEPLVPPAALEDNPDLVFRDYTDWSIVDSWGRSRYRYNDPDQHRSRADSLPDVRRFLMDNYVRFARIDATHTGGGVSRARAARAVIRPGDVTDLRAGTVSQEDLGEDGVRHTRFNPMRRVPGTPADDLGAPGWVYGGFTMTRGLEFSAKEKGVQFMLHRHMDEVIRQEQFSGRVLGIQASYSPRHDPDTGERLVSFGEHRGGEWAKGLIDERRETINIRARKAVILGAGGNHGNPQFRQMFYPAGLEPSHRPNGWALLGPGRANDASGILAGMRVGANLAGMEQGFHNSSSRRVNSLLATPDAAPILPGNPTFAFQGSYGLNVGTAGFEHLIAVNQVGRRFSNEITLTSRGTNPRWPNTATANEWDEHTPGDWRNMRPEWIREVYNRPPGINAALAINEGSQAPNFLPGPIWAIFDAAAVERGGWNIEFPYTSDNGYFFTADTIEELAAMVMANPHSNVPMSFLTETVDAWNSYVDDGVDPDFERDQNDQPMHRIDTPPFHAAFIVVEWHDSCGGLRINGNGQVLDTQGEVIPGLYAGGENSGGSEQHGLGRACPQGYIAATHAVEEPSGVRRLG